MSDDLISRQAAIDALGKDPGYKVRLFGKSYDEGRSDQWFKDVYKLTTVPSAQPVEDIRAMCGECDAWNQYKNYPQPGWIPCSRELPKKDGQYNVTVKYEHVDGYEDIYSEHGEWVDGHWDAGYGHCGRVEKVLAWMPLPKPYADEKDGDGV